MLYFLDIFFKYYLGIIYDAIAYSFFVACTINFSDYVVYPVSLFFDIYLSKPASWLLKLSTDCS